MTRVSLDTSFLITFADPNRPHHEVAKQYFNHCVTAKIPMFLSTIAAGEFAVRQAVTDLPLQNFCIQSYNMAHAKKAAEFYRSLKKTDVGDSRKIIINDLKILAQAEEDEIQTVLAEDKNTLWKMSGQLRKNSTARHVSVLLLSEGFLPHRLTDTAQSELSFAAAN